MVRRNMPRAAGLSLDADALWDAVGMPWAPELFSGPALERLLGKRRREELVAVPYFAWNNRGKGEMAVWIPYR